MASQVTLPGGGTVKYTLPVGSDASAALTTAIKSEFDAAAKGNITMNVVGSNAPGKNDFFNAVLNKGGAGNVKLTAGVGVQAIFDLGTGKDTLIGGAKTNLIYGNALATKGDSISLTGSLPTTVFGTAGADTLSVASGNVVAYMEGGANKVTLTGTSDTISFPGTDAEAVSVAGSTKASIVGGSGALSVTTGGGAATIKGGTGNLTVKGGTGNMTITAGSGKVSAVGGTGTINFTHGNGGADTVVITKNSGTDSLTGALGSKGSDLFSIGKTAGGKYVIDSFSSTTDKIKIVGATSTDITNALKNAVVKTKGGVTTTTLTIGADKLTIVGGAVNKTNFTS